MLWIKDGKLFDGRLELDGKVMFIAGDPDPELMRRAGYAEYVPPAPEPAPKRYSKLKIIRALGDSRTPVVILAISSVINIVSTAALVFLTPIGVAGAAIATVLSQIVSCILSWSHLRRRLPLLRLTRADLRPTPLHLNGLLRGGAIVEPYKVVAVHLLMQHGEVLLDLL